MTPYIYSTDSITVIVDGAPHVITSDHTQYAQLVEALKSQNIEEVRRIVAIPLVELTAVFGAVEVFGGHVTLNGETVNNYLVTQILAFKERGLPIEPLCNFLANVQLNPSRRAVEDLYAWCEAGQLPITPDGCIIAYKIVGPTFLDLHSGKFDNSPGQRVQVARNMVDDNPDQTCSHGLHFCSAAYLPHYGQAQGNKVVLLKVNPADVVAFPKDYNLSKARCCGYDVMEEIDRDTAATFFAGSGPVYGVSVSTLARDHAASASWGSAQERAAEAGYTVFYEEDVEQWDWRDANGDISDTYFDTQAEAWEAADQDREEKVDDEPEEDDDHTDRLDGIVDYLNLVVRAEASNTETMGVIEATLGIPIGTSDLDDRLDRAEAILNI